MPIPDPDEILPKLERDGVEEVKRKLLRGAYAEFKIPIVKEWLRQKEQNRETLEPKAPVIAQNIKWLFLYGRDHWKIVLVSTLVILIPFIVKIVIKEEPTPQKPKESKSLLVNAGGDVTITYGISEETLKELHESLKGSDENKDKVRDRLLKTLDEKDIAIENREAQIHEWIKKYNELKERLAKRATEDTLTAQAKEKLDAGDLEGAEKLLKESLEKNLKEIDERQKVAANDAYELGSLKELQLEYQEAKNYFRQAVQLDPGNTNFLNEYGQIIHKLAEYKTAIDYFEKALKIDLEVYGDKHPNVANDYNNIGVAWDTIGNSQKAIDYYEKALKIDLEVYGDKHPQIAIYYNNIGSVWNTLGVSQKAIDYYEKALKIDLEVYGDKHPQVAIYYNNIGSAWNPLGDSQKAIDYFEKALKIFDAIYGSDHPHSKIVRDNIKMASKD